jgi:hypothetical protein
MFGSGRGAGAKLRFDSVSSAGGHGRHSASSRRRRRRSARPEVGGDAMWVGWVRTRPKGHSGLLTLGEIEKKRSRPQRRVGRK